ncbi:hypothetical protein C8034_v010874 [Colletotrichum sidae]|uniref:Uncharacterized protein n=1 Tax=Colletotrichum sidae TaxID=1347389 RepID=A0A4V6QFR3_9PEZI|nr:hypothetical protein C8034_v010874 [Colletotrichum sidae]
MHPQALRSAGSRIKPDVVAVKTCIRTLTTTHIRPSDDASNNSTGSGARQPTGRERSRAAASEINQLLRSGSSKSASTPAAGTPSTKPPSSFTAAPAPAAASASASPAPAKPNAIIDVKTLPSRTGTNFVRLPSSFRGRGGFPRGGGFGGNTRGGSGAGGRGGFAARGRGAGRGGRGGAGRGGRGGKPRTRRDNDADDADANLARSETWTRFFRPETEEEHTYVRAREQGLPEPFVPSVATLSAASLLAHAPALPLCGDASVQGTESVVLQGLRDVATNTAPGLIRQSTEYTARGLADRKHGGIHFWADPEQKRQFAEQIAQTPEAEQSRFVKAVKDARLADGAEKAVREYIADRMVKGKHETPVFLADVGATPVLVATQKHLHNETYTNVDAKKFDAKLAQLVARKPAAPAKGKAARA